MLSLGPIMLIRPWWLLALIPLLLVLWLWRRNQHRSSGWLGLIDSELVEHVLESAAGTHQSRAWYLAVAGGCLAVLILAGPVWEKREVPLFRGQEALVIVLDLSRSMQSDDISPSRITQARFKLSDLLDRIEDLQVGLIVFSEVPYIVSPLTDDVETLRAFLPALDTSVVPVQGGRLVPAIDKAVDLLEQADINQGGILLITDSSAGPSEFTAATLATEKGHSVSVLAVGTEAGRPIRREDGTLVQDNAGNIVIAGLDTAGLQQLARTGNGVFVRLGTGSEDVEQLIQAISQQRTHAADTNDPRQSEYWIEYGPWLIPLMMLYLLTVFRRGVL